MVSEDVWVLNGHCFDPRIMHVSKLGWMRTDVNEKLFYHAPAWMAHFVLEGGGVFEINGWKHEGAPGTLVFYPPDSHVVYYRLSRDTWGYAWFELSGEQTGQALAELGIDPQHLRAFLPHREEFEMKLHQIAHRLKHESHSPFAAHAAAWEIIEHVDNQLFKRQPPEPPLIHLATQIIDDNLRPLPNVAELADRLGVNRATLFRIFQQVHGVSPSEFIDNARFQRAREMLRHSNMSMLEVTRACGLSSQQYFSAWFQQRAGTSPRQYRKIS